MWKCQENPCEEVRTSLLCSAVSGAQPCSDQLAAESLALTAKYAKTPDTSSDVNREETASLQRVTTTITIIRSETGGGVRMASDAEIRMMMMLNSMDLEREAGPMSSEDRLFMGSHQGARTQPQSQVWGIIS